MESPLASSSTATTDGASKTNSTSTTGSSFPGVVPSPAPPFFANPFMTPFISQQPGTNQIIPPTNMQQMQQQFQQFAAAAANAQGGGVDPSLHQQNGSSDFRMNPFTGGFFLPPNQYQEMMQQYLQTLMLQAGNIPKPIFSEHQTPITTPAPNSIAQSPSPPLASNDPAAAAFNGLATFNLGQFNLASPTAPTPPLAAMTAAASMTFNALAGGRGSRQSTPSKVSTASVGIASNGASTNCSSSPSPSFIMMNGIPESRKDHQQRPSSITQEERPESTPIVDTILMASMESNKNGSIEDNVTKNEHEQQIIPESSPSKNTQENSIKTEEVETFKINSEPSLEEEKPKRKFDARADELFRKQMYEIEQEINRRIQNRNVRKLNEEELSQLLNETGFGNFVEAGKPNSEVSEQMGHLMREPSPPPAPKNPTLNQLRSSFSPPDTKEPILGGDPFPHSLITNPLPAYPFSFGNVQMAQPPSETSSIPFMPSSSTAYSVQHDLQPRQTTPLGYIPGLDPPPQQAPLDLQSNNNAPSTLPNPATITPEMAAILLKQIQESNPQLLSSLGLVPANQISQQPQPQFRLPAPPAASSAIPKRNGANSFHANASTSVVNENGWRQIDKRHSINGGESNNNAINQTQTNTTGQENNKENSQSQEPIWVMRDSYLKRLQREEQRSKELQNGTTAGPSTTGLNGADDDEEETDKLLNKDHNADIEEQIKTSSKKPASAKKEVMVHEPAVLIEGVLFRARYLGSTQLTCDGRPTKSSRMAQAQEAVARVKAPEGEIQPSTEIDLFISTEKIMVLNTDLQRISETDVRQDILMDHALRSISYIADIGDVVVLMARRIPQGSSTSSDEEDLEVRRTPRVVCHVFESEEASFIAQSIGQAFQVAYVEFLRANGIDDPAYLREIDYQEVLNSQELLGEELDLFSSKETQKDIVIPKKVGEPLGIVVVESGWGSMLPTVVVAKMEPNAPSARSNQLNIGDQIIAINGISLVGLPLAKAQQNIKNAKTSTAVRLTIVSTPPVVEVRIKRPDTKYQLGFSVQNGVICSLLRGGIAERGGIRVGHRIIEINHKSVVAIPHEKIVNMLATATGEIHMKTMPTSMFRLLTGQEVPNYI